MGVRRIEVRRAWLLSVLSSKGAGFRHIIARIVRGETTGEVICESATISRAKRRSTPRTCRIVHPRRPATVTRRMSGDTRPYRHKESPLKAAPRRLQLGDCPDLDGWHGAQELPVLYIRRCARLSVWRSLCAVSDRSADREKPASWKGCAPM